MIMMLMIAQLALQVSMVDTNVTAEEVLNRMAESVETLKQKAEEIDIEKNKG